MDQTQFITWLASGGGAAVALAFLAERIPAFQKLAPAGRGYVILLGSVVLALLSYLYLTQASAELQAQLSGYFQVVYGVVAAWIASQVAHKQDPAA